MSEKDDESFAAMFEREASASGAAGAKKPRTLHVGHRVEGVVVQVGRDAVFVELDGKRQAFFDVVDVRDADGTVPFTVGQTVSAKIVELDEAQGVIRLGRSLGRPGSAAELEQAKASGLAVEGKVTGANKGGLEVDVGGARAFCPMSQIDTRRVDDAEVKTLIGRTLHFVVTEVRDGGKSAVVSRRAHLEREARAGAERVMSTLAPAAVLVGTVTSVREFGAFVDLGGVEGLIPRSEVSHDRSVGVAEALSPGDSVEVQVHSIKEGEGASKKITLSLKALMADPWQALDIVEGKVIDGVITRITEFGWFVRLAPAVEGLLHVSELARGEKDKGGVGQELHVVVKSIDRNARKVSLVQAPEGAVVGSVVPVAGAAAATVRVGAIVTGTVDRIETYGVFVQIDGTKGRAGRGLVPVSELGVVRGTDLRKAFPEGTKVTAKVLETGDGRLRLSVKAAAADAERADYEAVRSKASSGASLGTFADLLKGKKR